MDAAVRRLRVLFVSDVSPLRPAGGGERVLWEQASRLARQGHDVHVLSRAPDTPVPARLEQEGVHIRHFSADRRSRAGFLWSAVRGARRAAEEIFGAGDIDVVNVQQPLAGYGALTAPGARGVPSLYTFLSPAPLEYRLRRRTTRYHVGGLAGLLGTLMLWAAEAACLRRATRIHVLSDFSAGELRRLYRIAAARVVKIPGGVDHERFRPAADRAAVRARLGWPAGRPVLLTVRNLEPRMGLDHLLRAMARLRTRVPAVLLLIGGVGSLREPLERIARALALGDHVRFLGFVPDAELPAHYQAADVFVLPTRAQEGFGLVTAEALASGTPVLGTPVGATPELLAPLDPGLVFRDATQEAIAEGVERFLARAAADPEAAARLRAACRRHAVAHYTWEQSAAGLARVLGELAVRAGGPAARPIVRT